MKVSLVLLSVLCWTLAHCQADVVWSLDVRGTCASEYRKTAELRSDKAEHTMCKYSKSPDYKSGGVSTDDIKVILDKHNEYRSDPKTSKTAAAMCKIYWDPHIAKIAQHYADCCPKNHDKNNIVPGYGFKSGGQNLAFGYTSWPGAMKGWFEEVKYFIYGKGSEDPNDKKKEIGHYTMMVRDQACRVGCGYAKCSGRTVFVCNYLTGQKPEHLAKPFVSGAPCEKCKNTCKKNLCDCKGKMCYNGGSLDMNTCKCACLKSFSGDSCQKLVCTGPDGSKCGKPKPGYPPEYCTKYGNVPSVCPVMCKLCTKDKKPGNNWLPAPAVTMKSSSGSGASYPAGSATTGKAALPPGADTADCSGKDHPVCATSHFKKQMCEYGNKMPMNLGGQKGTPVSFCPHFCGFC